MKKSILVLGILVMAIGAVSAQEMNPFRIEVGMDGPYAAEVTYAIPIDSMSLSLSGGVAYDGGLGWLGKLTFYPLSSTAEGWLVSLGLRSTRSMEIFIGAGYQFLFWDWLSLHFAFNVGYNLNGEVYPGTGSSFSFPPAILLGIAF
ncbi:hypothetical protein MASR2M29_02330 [Spirochaetota bacterium]